MSEDAILLHRFLRTVRVTTRTALAEYELTEGRAALAAPVRFEPLAARAAGDWRFPEAGVASSDGLLLAHVERDATGRPRALVLQAQGSTGLASYASRRMQIGFGPLAPRLAAAFDRDGRAVADLRWLLLEEADLARFTLLPTEDE